MFLKAQLQWNIKVPARELDRGLALQKTIIVRLFGDVCCHESYKRSWLFLSSNQFGQSRERKSETGLNRGCGFPVTFTCMTFKVFKGEVLECQVHKILKLGIFLRCGPIENIFLPCPEMLDYSFVTGDNPMFVSERSAKTEKGAKLRIMVVGVQYMEAEKEFLAGASLDGDFLGPK